MSVLSGALITICLFQVLALVYTFKLAKHRLFWADKLEKEKERVEVKEQHAREELFSLRHEIDILSAIREISLVANQDIDIKRIMGNILTITQELVGTDYIAIHLFDKKANGLRLKAQKHGKQIQVYEAAPQALELLAVEAFNKKRCLSRMEFDTLSLAVPMMADHETMGVLRADILTSGLKESCFREKEEALKNLAKPIALAIQKPTLYDMAVVDQLTSLYTKRHFIEQLRKYFGASLRLGNALSLILMDIDHFKAINDTHGHLAGDAVLREVSQVIMGSIREYDTAYRYGGEELAVVAPDCNLEDARLMAERLRLAVADKCYGEDLDKEIKVTVSIGVASFHGKMKSMEKMIDAADTALYQSKNSGRNQVSISNIIPLAA